MSITIAIIEDIQYVLYFPDATLYTRAEVYILDLGGDEREDGLGASATNEECFGGGGNLAWGTECVGGEER